MNFHSQGRPLSDGGMDQICNALGIFEPEVWAILTVETRGFGFFQDRRPQILFERHIFHRLTNGRHDTGNSDISNEKAGGYIGGPGEYQRLEKAMELEPSAALQSASWGIGQVMGFNFKSVGFATVNDMVAAMVKDENAQLLAVANFIKENNLAGALQRNNWVSFARGYNGPDFKKNEYDTRLAAAHAKYKIILPDLALRSAQAALVYLGIDPGPIDGVRGRRTSSALMQFQKQVGLPETGQLDRDTESKLLEKAFPA
ncbi:N-acetylmuramidase domain-containing protein [Pseudomonas sp. GL-RE-20]|uniref:N-acetylmuramidase domain-containing protein n=1 Tax=Pseudomonas sp. GL-RE-20 TaxID=2832372 RepID=UPI001CBB88DC|nr:N-acetylmuramidase domain-containing protein [Pseudomonas sp. GL-RE-20]